MSHRGPASVRFIVEIDGKPVAGFEALHAAIAAGVPARPLQPHELGRLAALPAPAQGRQFHGITNRFSQGSRVPGGGPPLPFVTLKRGAGNAAILQQWSGSATPHDAVLTTLDQGGRALARYKLTNAWPVKWYAPPPSAKGGDVAMEEITLASEGMSRI